QFYLEYEKGDIALRKWLVLSLVFALSTVLIACGSSSGSSKKPEPPIEVSDDEIVSGALEIIASNWDFDKEYYAIRAGEAIEVNVNSIEGVHGIEIVGTEYNNIVNQKPTTITINEPGTYEVRCSIPCGGGHRTM